MGFPKGASIPFGQGRVKTPPAKRFRLLKLAESFPMAQELSGLIVEDYLPECYCLMHQANFETKLVIAVVMIPWRCDT